ncbi:hypothetical protein BH20ACI2_BH20ACI2_09760 [soil metagenome]
MNIDNRLTKLENIAGINSEFCSCRREVLTRVIAPDLDRTETEHDALIAEAQKPEYCDQCKKEIEKQLIIIQAASRNDTQRETTPGEILATFNIATKIDRFGAS